MLPLFKMWRPFPAWRGVWQPFDKAILHLHCVIWVTCFIQLQASYRWGDKILPKVLLVEEQVQVLSCEIACTWKTAESFFLFLFFGGGGGGVVLACDTDLPRHCAVTSERDLYFSLTCPFSKYIHVVCIYTYIVCVQNPTRDLLWMGWPVRKEMSFSITVANA